MSICLPTAEPIRMKVLVHDGIGIWLAARRLNQGRFVWPLIALAIKWHSHMNNCRL